MMIARALEEVVRDPDSIVTVGTFDGIHLGHREIIRETVRQARTSTARSAVVTFEPHPKQVVRSDRGPVALLSTLEEKLKLLEDEGVDLVWVLPFTREFARQTPREFYERVIVGRLGVRAVVVGADHMFGRDRTGGATELNALAREFGFSLTTIPPLFVDEVRVSSTVIRKALAEGDVARAGRYLGYPYSLSARVVEGDRRGRALGFPTANLDLDNTLKVIPARGVYVVEAEVSGESKQGMMNIGVRPTLTDGGRLTLEAHLFGVERDLYGERVRVSFLVRLREEKRFASAQDLVRQLHQDKEEAQRLVRRPPDSELDTTPLKS
jgi:riboflavin kinase/FMN adenylyltransferase